jgi:hypothetical protein
MRWVCHVAIADDWDGSLSFGSDEAATRRIPYDEDEPIRAVIPERLQAMLDDRYQDLTLRLLLILLDADALTAAGTPVDREPNTGRVKMSGPLPPGDDTIVHAVIPLDQVGAVGSHPAPRLWKKNSD